MRLPGSAEEIAASPEGPTVGAFFDFDGTLIAGYSATHFSAHRLRNRDVTADELVRMVGLVVNAGRGRAGFEDLLKTGAAAWKGRRHEDLQAMGECVFEERIADVVYPEARALVVAHLERGHTVVLSSSATEYQIEPVAKYLGIDHVLCNRYAKSDGVLTGELETPVIWGPTKASVVQRFAGERGVDITRSYFYADGDEDTALMYLVGHPRPTNPGKKLAKVAAARGWPTLRFTSRSSRRRGSPVKQLASGAALVAATTCGVAVGLLRRDRRAGVNFATPRWLSTLFSINGVKLDVVGRDNLTAQRPAVFVFNHRNHFDALLAASLVERDFSAVVDNELATDPISRALGGLADTTFVDWNDPTSKADALSRVEDAAMQGRSILIAPEGRCVDTMTVGPFEHDAFRVAVAAGIPIVPIVVRNAELIAGRNSAAMVPGLVNVAVLKPIPVDAWSLDTLHEHVAEVRQQFIDTLVDWPT